MLLNQLYAGQSKLSLLFNLRQKTIFYSLPRMQSTKTQEKQTKFENDEMNEHSTKEAMTEIFPAPRVVPMVVTKPNPEVLPFDNVPGPKALKYFSNLRQYSFQIGTQLTAGFLTLGLNMRSYMTTRSPLSTMSALFDEYGPVVRFVSPVGADIVFLSHPDHIQKVYATEGEYPVRSALDSLEKYRTDRSRIFGLYSVRGQEWERNRSLVCAPLHTTVSQNLANLKEISDSLASKIYNQRNYQDEFQGDLYKELHKWSYDCMGLILFAKKFTMLETELVYSQDDVSWLFNSLEKATEAINKCESGFHMWKLFPTLAWYSLVKHCDIMDGLAISIVAAISCSDAVNKCGRGRCGSCVKILIGKQILQAKEAFASDVDDNSFSKGMESVVAAMLMDQQQLKIEDVSTVLMDMLLIGVNTISTSMSFLLYHLAKYQRTQNVLLQEVDAIVTADMSSVQKLKDSTPYLQACIMETLRLVPPIPMLSRILPKNIILDKYNIPRGTLIIMANQDACRKESNFDEAERFYPERWLKDESRDYHAFASIPFGYGARKCLGQNMAEAMMSLLTIQVLKKFKLEYHYGDIKPTRRFICKPNKPLKIRFVERIN